MPSVVVIYRNIGYRVFFCFVLEKTRKMSLVTISVDFNIGPRFSIPNIGGDNRKYYVSRIGSPLRLRQIGFRIDLNIPCQWFANLMHAPRFLNELLTNRDRQFGFFKRFNACPERTFRRECKEKRYKLTRRTRHFYLTILIIVRGVRTKAGESCEPDYTIGRETEPDKFTREGNT